MSKETNPNLDQFEEWRNGIEQAISDFLTSLPSSVRLKLDFTRDSLDILGDWILDEYRVPFSESGEVVVQHGLIYYIGETYRKNLGGNWNVHFAELEPDYRYGEEPVIEGFFEDMAVCPSHLILVMLGEKRKEFLSGLLRTYMKMYKTNR